MSDVLWKKGKEGNASVFVIEVYVKLDNGLQSFRKLQDSTDEEIVSSLPTGGMLEASWALLTEAIKQEALLQTLVRMSNEPDFLAKLQAEDPNLTSSLESSTLKHLQSELPEIVPALVQDVLRTVRHGTHET